MVLDFLHHWGRRDRRGDFAAMRSVPADGPGCGETDGDPFLKGSGVAVGVVCWRWCDRLCGANKVTVGWQRTRHLIGIEFLWDC